MLYTLWFLELSSEMTVVGDTTEQYHFGVMLLFFGNNNTVEIRESVTDYE